MNKILTKKEIFMKDLDKKFVKNKVRERLNNIEYIGANKSIDVNVQIQNFAWGSNDDSRNAYVDITLNDKNQKNKIDLKIEYIEKPENFIVLELNGKKLEGENLEKLFASRDNLWRKEL